MISSALVFLSLVVGLAPAQDTHTIKIKKSAKGDVIKVEDTDSADTTTALTDAAGTKVLDRKDKTSKSDVYQETTIEKPAADRATSLKRAYEKSRETKEGKEETRVYEGKTVLIEKQGDKYKFTIEGGKELTGKEAEDLDKSFNKKSKFSEEELEKFFLPSKAVKVGETWKPDVAGLLKELGKESEGAGAAMTFDTAKAEASGKLVEVYDKDGHKFGKMDFKLVAPIKDFTPPGAKFSVKDGSKIDIDIHFDVCIDGSVSAGQMKGDMTMKLDATVATPDGKDLTMMLNVKSMGKRKETEVKK